MTIKYILDNGDVYDTFAEAQQAEREGQFHEKTVAWIADYMDKDWADTQIRGNARRIAWCMVTRAFTDPSCPFTIAAKERD